MRAGCGVDARQLAAELPDRKKREAALEVALRRHAVHGGASGSLDDLVLCGCVTRLATSYWLSPERAPLEAMGDEEQRALPSALPPVIDAHVHLFPDRVLAALWSWFERYAWPIRYKLSAPDTASFLFARGVSRIVALHYGHKPGMSRALNTFVAELAKADPRIVPLGTVLPGEPDALAVIDEIAQLGFAGIKLHCHVQGFAVDAEDSLAVLGACAERGLAVVVHAGREPKSPMYPVDPHDVCDASRIERVLRALPTLRLCVPHLGADEFEAYGRLLTQFDNLYLDTTMTMAGFLTDAAPTHLLSVRPSRVLYGTDFPNLPYAWSRELTRLLALGLDDETLALLLGGAARTLFGLDDGSSSALR